MSKKNRELEEVRTKQKRVRDSNKRENINYVSFYLAGGYDDDLEDDEYNEEDW